MSVSTLSSLRHIPRLTTLKAPLWTIHSRLFRRADLESVLPAKLRELTVSQDLNESIEEPYTIERWRIFRASNALEAASGILPELQSIHVRNGWDIHGDALKWYDGKVIPDLSL